MQFRRVVVVWTLCLAWGPILKEIEFKNATLLLTPAIFILAHKSNMTAMSR